MALVHIHVLVPHLQSIFQKLLNYNGLYAKTFKTISTITKLFQLPLTVKKRQEEEAEKVVSNMGPIRKRFKKNEFTSKNVGEHNCRIAKEDLRNKGQLSIERQFVSSTPQDGQLSK